MPDPNQVGGKLFELTGSLQPSGRATESELERARAALSATIAAGVAPETRPIEISGARGATRNIAFDQLGEAAKLKFTRVPPAAALGFIGNSPVSSDFGPSTPTWARGMATEFVGPFQNEGPAASWVQILHLLPQRVNIRYGGNLVAVVPLAGPPVVGRTSFPLSAGSVWIDAQRLAATSPAQSWTGFLIKDGTLTLSQYQVVAGEIVLNPTATFSIRADLAPPAPPPLITGPSADASAVSATLPAKLAINFTQASATVTGLGNISATIYGSSLTLTRNAKPPQFEARLGGVLIPFDISGSPSFAFKSVQSTLFKPTGSPPITEAGWILPVAITTPDKLGAASGAGAVGFLLGAGAMARWPGLSASMPLGGAAVAASPGHLAVIFQLAATSAVDVWQLWNGKVRPSSLEFTHPQNLPILYVSSAVPIPGEAIFSAGSTIAHADRPVAATGLLVPVSLPMAIELILQTPQVPSGILLIEGAAASLPPGAQPASFALENALLEALPPRLMVAGGTIQTNRIRPGLLFLDFGLTAFLPTLPDPYASSTGLIGDPPTRGTGPNAVTPRTIGAMRSSVVWLELDKPDLAFGLIFASPASGATALTPGTIGRFAGINLLDVSSNADQFGVNWAPERLSSIQSEGLLLASEGVFTSLFTVSAISWEPMIAADPFAPPSLAPSDGVPSKLTVPTVALVPIAPLPLMAEQQSSVASGNPFNFTGTLPFGMIAEVDGQKAGGYSFVQPAFDNFEGGRQISLTPANAGKTTKPEFSGQTILTDPYGTSVLSSDVATIFRNDFSNVANAAEPGVPVERYDLSGYGASLFSDWNDPNVDGTGILKVRFEVFVGRTAYEVVKAQSIIYPWGIKIVRTITIQRLSGGDVLRKDSGWQAATAGAFVLPPHDSKNAPQEFVNSFHPGPIEGVFNVRHIRDNGAQFVLDGNTYVPVLFDADVKVNASNPVVSGAVDDVFVPSRDLVGYAQLGPDNSPASRTALADLLHNRGATRGPIACTLNVGAAGQQMKVSAVEVSAVGNGQTALFVAALRGIPVLPRDGQWTMGVRSGGQTPQALDPQAAVPLIQPNGATTWFLADPADIQNLGNPQVQYGLLQGTGTQKTFLASPRITQGVNKVSIPNPPHVADVGALLGASGIFPDLAKALAFPAAQDLVLGALGDDTLTLNTLAPFPVTQPPLTLVDFGPVSVVLVYEDRAAGNPGPPTMVTFSLTPAGTPRWSIKFAKFTFVLVSPFGGVGDPLLQVVGSAHADSESAPTLGELTVLYGSILSLVQQVFSKLNELASFLPGGNKSFLDVSFSNGKLTIRDKFALPTLPLGLGDITNVALDLGAALTIAPLDMQFTAGISSPDEPFQWLVSPLTGTGCVVVGFDKGDASLLIQAGIGLGLAIDVGIAEGSASIVLAFQVDNTVSPFEVKVILTGQAQVDVLGGLASAALMLSAGLTLIPALPDITLIGSVAVGIHISICWVVSIDFDGSWQFSQTLTA